MGSTAFFVILFVHLACLIMAFGAVMATDHFGLRWMRHQVPFSRLVRVAGTTERLVWIGWTGLVVTGIALASLKGQIDRLMILKLFCVGLAGANGLALQRILKAMRPHADTDSVPSLLMFRLAVSLLVSQIAWWGAFTIGFLHRQVQTVIEWPARPWLWIALFSALVLCVWAAGEWALRRRPSRLRVERREEADRIGRGPGPTWDPLGKED